MEPRPSTVVTCAPWQLASGTLHEVTVTSSSLGSPPPSLQRSCLYSSRAHTRLTTDLLKAESSTVQDPQAASPHESLVPVRPLERRCWARLVSSRGRDTEWGTPFTQSCSCSRGSISTALTRLTTELTDKLWCSDEDKKYCIVYVCYVHMNLEIECVQFSRKCR